MFVPVCHGNFRLPPPTFTFILLTCYLKSSASTAVKLATSEMEPSDALWTDRSAFESELDDLIDSAMGSSSDGTSLPSRKRAAVQDPPSKHLRTEDDLEKPTALVDYSRHVYPSRRVLLDRPGAFRLREVFCKPIDKEVKDEAHTVIGPQTSPSMSSIMSAQFSPSDQTGHNKTWSTLANTVRRQWDSRKADLEYESLLEHRRKENLEKVDRYVPEHPGPKRLLQRPAPFPTGEASGAD